MIDIQDVKHKSTHFFGCIFRGLTCCMLNRDLHIFSAELLPGGCLVHVKNSISKFGHWCTLCGSVHLDIGAFHRDLLVHVKNYIQNFGHRCTLCGSIHLDIVVFHGGCLAMSKITSEISDFGALCMDQYIWMAMTYTISDFGAFHRIIWSMSKFQIFGCIFATRPPYFSCIFAIHPSIFQLHFFHFTWPYFYPDLFSAPSLHLI